MEVFTRQLRLKVPWTVAHGTSATRTNVYLDLGDGLGEAPIVPYYPYDERTVADWLLRVAARLPADPGEHPDAFIADIEPGPPPAAAALDVALYDRWGRSQERPLFELWGLDQSAMPRSSITLSIPETDEAFLRALEHVKEWPLLKLKLGTGSIVRDQRLVTLARERTDADLCVDANGGWNVREATEIIPALTTSGVLFVEEPLKDASLQAWENLRENISPGAPLLVADESFQEINDVQRLAPYVDGINVKLAKTGGLTGALRAIREARAHGLKILLGCMVESSLGVTAAAHLAPLADFADLDGHLQIENDPFVGATVDRGMIRLPARPGLGVSYRIDPRSSIIED